jgi:uncharacterized protein YjbJ (UPF0337 family)
MGTDDKISNKAEELKGQGKEAVGKATGDERLEAEGKADQVMANLKQAGEKIKEAAKGIFNDVGGKISNKAEELKGKGKEATGKATGDERLEAEGKADQVMANLKQAGEKIKEAAKGIFKD